MEIGKLWKREIRYCPRSQKMKHHFFTAGKNISCSAGNVSITQKQANRQTDRQKDNRATSGQIKTSTDNAPLPEYISAFVILIDFQRGSL